MWTGVVVGALLMAMTIWAIRVFLLWATKPYPNPTTDEIKEMNRRLRREGLDPKKAWKEGENE